jgi:hypothetical protein
MDPSQSTATVTETPAQPQAAAPAEPTTASTTTAPVSTEPQGAQTEPPAARGGIGAAVANAISDRATLIQRNAEMAAEIGTLRQQLATAQRQIADGAQQLEQARTQHAAQITQTEQSVGAQVAAATIDTVAQLGVPEDQLPAAASQDAPPSATRPPTREELERRLTERAAAHIPAIRQRLN